MLVDRLFKAPDWSPTPKWLTAALNGFVFRSESSWHRNVDLLVERLFRPPVMFTPDQITLVARALFVGPVRYLPITYHFSTFGQSLTPEQCEAIGRELTVAPHYLSTHGLDRLLVSLVEKGPEEQALAVARGVVSRLAPAPKLQLDRHMRSKDHSHLADLLELDPKRET